MHGQLHHVPASDNELFVANQDGRHIWVLFTYIRLGARHFWPANENQPNPNQPRLRSPALISLHCCYCVHCKTTSARIRRENRRLEAVFEGFDPPYLHHIRVRISLQFKRVRGHRLLTFLFPPVTIARASDQIPNWPTRGDIACRLFAASTRGNTRSGLNSLNFRANAWGIH